MPKVSQKQIEPIKHELEWESGNISARCRGFKSVCISAMVCGPLAIHSGLQDENLWAITHRAIGYNFIELPDDDEAIELATLLLTDHRFDKAMRQRTWTNFFKELPAWVKTWRDEMLKQRRLIPITEFERDGEKTLVKENPFMVRYLDLRDRHDNSKDAEALLLVQISGGYECYQKMAIQVAEILKLPLLTRADLEMVRIIEKDLKKSQGLLQQAGYKTVIMTFLMS